MRISFLIPFIFPCVILSAQENLIDQYCIFKTRYDSIHVVSKLEKLYKKAGRSHPVNYLKKAEIAYAIGDYWERGVDSLSRKWLRASIDDLKKHYSKCKKAEQKSRALYMIAICYFRIGLYRDAEAFFAKTMKIEYGYACKGYYMARTLMINGKFKEAVVEFKLFGEAAKTDVSNYIKECEEKAER
jgi:hypothetical protein